MNGWWGRDGQFCDQLAVCRSQLLFRLDRTGLCPELRGQPIAIVPIRVETQTGCCIAVSYQAKAYGVKTGFSVADAKLLCPHIILVEARPRLYVEYHHRIAAAIERCIPIQQVMSCDEFAC
jgi:DNA polymerase-4